MFWGALLYFVAVLIPSKSPPKPPTLTVTPLAPAACNPVP
jgi:hypothetical protein